MECDPLAQMAERMTFNHGVRSSTLRWVTISGYIKITYAPLAQLDRVFGYEPKGQGFESLTARQKRTWIFQVLFVLL